MNINELQDKHKGKLAFVVGAGPSLHFQNVAPLKDYVTLTVNSSILKIPDCDYYVSDDEGVSRWNYFQETARESKCIKLLYKEKLKDHVSHLRPEEVVLFDHKWWYNPNGNQYNFDGLKLTKEASAPIIGARTSAGTALHFAYIMGCDPIVLVGCDCCYSGRNRYFWMFPGEKKAIEQNNRVFSTPNRGTIKGKPVDNHCVSFEEYWTHLARVNAGEANIIYASEGGILDCFPKMTLPQVLEKYGDRKK
jgi:hypothetical protein